MITLHFGIERLAKFREQFVFHWSSIVSWILLQNRKTRWRFTLEVMSLKPSEGMQSATPHLQILPCSQAVTPVIDIIVARIERSGAAAGQFLRCLTLAASLYHKKWKFIIWNARKNRFRRVVNDTLYIKLPDWNRLGKEGRGLLEIEEPHERRAVPLGLRRRNTD